MKELIRGVACMALALGATACEDDPSIDFGGSPTMVQLSPNVMFINSGKTKELLVRLVNDRNQAVPTSFTVSNVGAGLNVVFDTAFRPQQTGAEPEPTSPLIKTQQRYFIEADLPGGGQRTFTLTSSGISGSPTINIEPSNTGALSATAPALGEPITINAPDGQSFTTTGSDTTTVSFDVGGTQQEAIITARTATSITFLPLPGSTGPATVTGITLNFAPTLAARDLESPNEITVPAVASIPLAYSTGTPAAGAAVTVTAPGFRFRPDATFDFGTEQAFVLSISADSSTATILPPPNMAAQAATVSNVSLSFLPLVGLSNLSSTATLTTPAYPAAPAGGATTGDAPIIAADAPGQGVAYTEAGTLNFGADVNFLGGNNAGAPRYYRLDVTVAGSYTINISWNLGGDMDLYLRDAANTTTIAQSPTGDNPESVTATLPVGSYFIVLHNWQNLGPVPTEVLITVK